MWTPSTDGRAAPARRLHYSADTHAGEWKNSRDRSMKPGPNPGLRPGGLKPPGFADGSRFRIELAVNMPRATVTLEFKGRTRSLTVPSGAVLIGRAPDCDVVLPFPWIREHHLEVQDDAGWRRIRCVAEDAKALLGGRRLSTEWTVLPDEATVELPTPFQEIIRLDFAFRSRTGSAAVLIEERAT